MGNEERLLLLHVQGVSKSFPGVKALEDMHLDLRAGEVLALVGENGAGKSTLMKLLSGIYSADEGEFFLDGEPYEPTSPKHAQELGHQHHPPGVQPDARPDGRAEHLHRARAARLAASSSASAALNAQAQELIERLHLPLRAHAARRRPHGRQAADGRDRQGAVLRRRSC